MQFIYKKHHGYWEDFLENIKQTKSDVFNLLSWYHKPG